MRPNQSSKIVEAHIPCPSCPSSDAYCLYDDGHGYCYSCEYYLSAKREFNPLISTATYEYLPIRGIDKATLKQYDVKTKIDNEGKPLSIGFQYIDNAFKVRDLSKKSFFWMKDGNIGADTSKTGLFGKDKFNSGSAKCITITEGEFDALSMYQALRGSSPVVSVQSSSTAVRDCSVDIDYLRSFERVYLAFDNDHAGKAALASVAKLFDFNRVFHVRLDRFKDANDYLQAGAADELAQVWYNAKKYQPESIHSTLGDFEKILTEQRQRGWRIYPSAILNEMTDGIRTSETVLVTAPEGVGKTELMHHIEFNFLKERPDEAVGAIFLEEPKYRHLQALAGLELGRPVHLPNVPVTSAELIGALRATVVSDDRLHLYSHFGSDDPDLLLDTIRYLVVGCSCKLVLLDHITMAVSGLAGEDERRALDWLSTRLEMMVKELDFALVLVSHVNDHGQTRGSRYIGKVADLRIDMFRDTMAEDPYQRNIVKFSIPKNRPIGRTGPAGEVYYNQDTGRYEDHAQLFQPPSIIQEANAEHGRANPAQKDRTAANANQQGSEAQLVA